MSSIKEEILKTLEECGIHIGSHDAGIIENLVKRHIEEAFEKIENRLIINKNECLYEVAGEWVQKEGHEQSYFTLDAFHDELDEVKSEYLKSKGIE